MTLYDNPKNIVFKDKNFYLCLLIASICAIGSFIYFIWKDSGVFVLWGDFNFQQIPFLTALNNLITDYSGQWAWTSDLGTSILSAYSFYELGSPFSWLMFIFPAEWTPYVIGWIYAFKYVVAALTSFAYLRLFTKDSKYAIVGALLYAFSGFQAANLIFFHFHDVVAFFPILLIGLEKLLRDNKRIFFIFGVALNCTLNYYFFIGEVGFVVLYFIFRYWGTSKKDFIKQIISCLLCGILGVGIASCLFVPSIIYVSDLDRANTNEVFYTSTLLFTSTTILGMISSFVLPAESMGNHTTIFAPDETCMGEFESYMSMQAYLPMIGVSLVVAYLLRYRNKEKDWLSKFIVFLFFVSLSPPVISALFYAGTTVELRWWYMLVLMMSLVSTIVLENHEEYSVMKGIVCNAILIIGFIAVVVLLPFEDTFNQRLINPETTNILIYQIFTALIGIAVLALIEKSYESVKNKKRIVYVTMSFVAVFSLVTTTETIHIYRTNVNGITTSTFMQFYNVGTQLETYDEQYRYNITVKNAPNLIGMTGDAGQISSFSSTLSKSISELGDFFNYTYYEIKNITLDPNLLKGLPELLGAKYEVKSDLGENDEVVDSFVSGDKTYFITESDACPIGFAYDSYVVSSELENLLSDEDLDKKSVIMLDNLIISKTDEATVSKTLEHNDDWENYEANDAQVAKSVEENLSRKVNDFDRDNSGFTCTTDYEIDSVVYFTVPYDDGWTAFVDGNETKIYQSVSFMYIIVPEGNHSIQFKYETPGLKLGIIITSISLLFFVGYSIFEVKKIKIYN